MKVSFHDTAGGKLTAKTLKKYASKLKETYGKNAYRYFAKTDMRILKERGG